MTAYTLDLAAPLSQVLSDGTANYVYGNGAERLRAAGGDWYIPDALGSVRATLDASGAMLATTSYDPWGLPQASAIAPFGFTGEVQDAHGMVYLRARWYDAGSGRFGVRDPFAGFPEVPYSLNPYQYAYAAPTVYTDPSGEIAIFVHGGYGNLPQDNNNAVYQLADKFVDITELGSIVKQGPGGSFLGNGVISSRYTEEFLDIVKQMVRTYDESCGDEPIILMGYSRGGAAMQSVLAYVSSIRPEITVDLVITVGPVNIGQAGGSAVNQKPNARCSIRQGSDEIYNLVLCKAF